MTTIRPLKGKLNGYYPHIKIIMTTVFDNDENIFKAIMAGPIGYLLKEIDAENLHKSILIVITIGTLMTSSIALKTLYLLRNPISIDNSEELEILKLTNRETDILEHLSKGLNYQEIARNLIISPSTVQKHIENIYKNYTFIIEWKL